MVSSNLAVVNIPTKTYEPCGHNVTLHVFKDDKTKGGLLLPDGSDDPFVTIRSLVIAIGPDVKKCKVGDVVLMHAKQGATTVFHRNQKTYVINEDYLVGVEIPECPYEQPTPNCE